MDFLSDSGDNMSRKEEKQF